MSCERYTDAIIDHACGSDITVDALAHLGSCTACRQMFDEQKRLASDLDQQLQSALEIEPSARFVPDVMARVQRPVVRWRTRMWWSVPVAAAAVLILSTLGSLRSGERHTATGQDPGVLATALPAPAERTVPTLVPPIRSVDKPRLLDSRRRSARPRGTAEQPSLAERPRPIEPDVMVPPAQSQAIARYLTLVRRGALDTSALASLDRTDAETPTELVIAPLAVDALAMTDVERGIGPDVDRRGPGLR